MALKCRLGAARALVLVIALALAPPASAQDKKKADAPKDPAEVAAAEPAWPSPLDPGKFDLTYTLLPFGKDKAEFFVVLRQRFEQQLLPVLKATLNPHQRDVLKAQMDRDLAAVEKTWTAFTGQDTGYGVSVIAKEIRHNASEAVVKYMYGENAAYFLFSGAALWQLHLCVEANTPFDELAKRLAEVYEQAPDTLAYENPEEKAGLISATWRDTTFEIIAMAPRGLFRCNTIRWVYLPAEEGIKTRRDAAAVLENNGSYVDDLLKQVTQDPGGDVDDVLDKVLKDK